MQNYIYNSLNNEFTVVNLRRVQIGLKPKRCSLYFQLYSHNDLQKSATDSYVTPPRTPDYFPQGKGTSLLYNQPSKNIFLSGCI